ncbi:MAG TPA: alpha amylase C-terminal domain-containing protein, partial [Negativicutes bacterium]
FLRKGSNAGEYIIVVCNFTPALHPNYRIGAPEGGTYREVFNSDWEIYGGSGQQNSGGMLAEAIEYHGQAYSLSLKIPPLATIYLKKMKE